MTPWTKSGGAWTVGPIDGYDISNVRRSGVRATKEYSAIDPYTTVYKAMGLTAVYVTLIPRVQVP